MTKLPLPMALPPAMRPTDTLSSRIEPLLWRLILARYRRVARERLQLSVEGLEHVPLSGPVIVAGRHLHDAYDMAGLAATIPRRVHFFVAVDWEPRRRRRKIMEWGARALRWPAIVRPEQMAWLRAENRRAVAYSPPPAQLQREAARDRAEAARTLRRATKDAVALLREGRLIIIAPEGYAGIGQAFNPKTAMDAALPFQPGFLRLARQAQKNGGAPVAIVPVGAWYASHDEKQNPDVRWPVVLRFAPPLFFDDSEDEAAFISRLETIVAELCRPPQEVSQRRNAQL